ncbi:MAG TPA: hypothetical protein VM784_08610 [Actinomycetota bacterium]|nr:hypothetical protein [Actinomycetota bacterium]
MTRDHGQALLETILLGLLLMIPLVWLLSTLADVHRSALATTAAVRNAGADAARATSLTAAGRAIDDAVARALADHGIAFADARVRWTAPPALRRGGAVEIEVSLPVSVLQAPFLGRIAGPSVWVHARHVARIDLFRSRDG